MSRMYARRLTISVVGHISSATSAPRGFRLSAWCRQRSDACDIFVQSSFLDFQRKPPEWSQIPHLFVGDEGSLGGALIIVVRLRKETNA